MDPKEASTIKRMAGNIAGSLVPKIVYDPRRVASEAVDLALAINDEVNNRMALRLVATKGPDGD